MKTKKVLRLLVIVLFFGMPLAGYWVIRPLVATASNPGPTTDSLMVAEQMRGYENVGAFEAE